MYVDRTFVLGKATMTQDTHQAIFTAAKKIFAERGYDGLSMRNLAKEVGISLSVIYHHYSDKDVLLEEIFRLTNTKLGEERKLLKTPKSTDEAILQRIQFQFDHMQDVVFILKYYLHYRSTFAKNATGWVPEKTSLHIQEVLEDGADRGELRSGLDVVAEAKIITHAINGFVLEYYPAVPTGREKSRIIRELHTFIMRSITDSPMNVAQREVPMR